MRKTREGGWGERCWFLLFQPPSSSPDHERPTFAYRLFSRRPSNLRAWHAQANKKRPQQQQHFIKLLQKSILSKCIYHFPISSDMLSRLEVALLNALCLLTCVDYPGSLTHAKSGHSSSEDRFLLCNLTQK